MITRFLPLIFCTLCLGTISNSYGQSPAEFQELIQRKRAHNQQIKKTEGFRIQLFNGMESKAYEIKKTFQSSHPHAIETIYQAPEWKVQVGNYRTRLEADRVLHEIKKEYPTAFVLQTTIRIK